MRTVKKSTGKCCVHTKRGRALRFTESGTAQDAVRLFLDAKNDHNGESWDAWKAIGYAVKREGVAP